MTDLYFIQYSYQVSPKNKYHEWIDNRFKELDRVLTRNPKKLQKELIDEIKTIREKSFPRCKPVNILTKTYLKIGLGVQKKDMLKVEVYELGRLVMYPVKEVLND